MKKVLEVQIPKLPQCILLLYSLGISYKIFSEKEKEDCAYELDIDKAWDIAVVIDNKGNSLGWHDKLFIALFFNKYEFVGYGIWD